MNVEQRLVATSLIRIDSVTHGSSAHRDPREEQFKCPEVIFTLKDRWGVRCGRGDTVAHPGIVVLGNQGEFYTCRHFAPIPQDRTIGVSFGGLAGPDNGLLSDWPTHRTEPLFRSLAVPFTRTLRWHFRQLSSEMTNRMPGFRLKVDVLCVSLLVDLVRLLHGGAPMAEHPSKHTTEALRQVRAYIDGHFADNMELLTLAGIAGLSPFHFSRLFKQFSGYSPHQYLLRARVDHAAKLLRDTRLSILEIALRVGFQDATHFARSFRRHSGLTPTTYRRGMPQD